MYFTQFVFTLTGVLALMTFILAWMLRSSNAWIGWKIIVPAFLVTMACYIPYTVSSMLGKPVSTDNPPCNVRLLADNVQKQYVDIWIMEMGVPRSYRIPNSKDLTKLLALDGEISERLANHDEVFLACQRVAGAPHYMLNKDAMSQLPPKILGDE